MCNKNTVSMYMHYSTLLQGAGFEAEIHSGDMRSRQSSPAHMCA